MCIEHGSDIAAPMLSPVREGDLDRMGLLRGEERGRKGEEGGRGGRRGKEGVQ